MSLLGSISLVARGNDAPVPDQDRAAFSQVGSQGCGLILVYGWNAQRTEAIVVEADQAALRLNKGSKTFDLANAHRGLRVHLDVSEKSRERFDYCSDLKSSEQLAVWFAQSGQITIAVGGRNGFHQATARLKDVVFRKTNGAFIKFAAPIVLTATVGGFSG